MMVIDEDVCLNDIILTNATTMVDGRLVLMVLKTGLLVLGITDSVCVWIFSFCPVGGLLSSFILKKMRPLISLVSGDGRTRL